MLCSLNDTRQPCCFSAEYLTRSEYSLNAYGLTETAVLRFSHCAQYWSTVVWNRVKSSDFKALKRQLLMQFSKMIKGFFLRCNCHYRKCNLGIICALTSETSFSKGHTSPSCYTLCGWSASGLLHACCHGNWLRITLNWLWETAKSEFPSSQA